MELLLGRLLLAALFLAGAVQKALGPQPVQGLLAGFGLPEALVWGALAVNAAIALALGTGRAVVPAARAGAAYCMATSLFHLIPDDPWQMSIFVKNWAIAGGLLALAALWPHRA